MRLHEVLFLAGGSALLSSCTWVEPDAAGSNVRVAYNEDLARCAKRGDVNVAVKDRVWFYDRNELKVRDELESLARNEAARIGADTVQARNEPREGTQDFAAYRCGR